MASSEGHLDVGKYLMGRGVKVNRWGGSPLDDAHRHRHMEVARFFMSKGASTGGLNLTSNLITAAAAGDIEDVKMLVGTGRSDGVVGGLVGLGGLDWSGSRRGAKNRGLAPNKD